MEIKTFYRSLPSFVKSLLVTSEGWIVGKSITQIFNNETVNDFDIIVPDRECFQKVVLQLAGYDDCTIQVNSYGGIKATFAYDDSDDSIIDIWCEELSHFLMNANNIDYIFNYKKQLLLKLQ